MSEGHIGRPPSKARLLGLTGVALAVGAGLTVLAVLPAEFHLDPTGFGRLTGLSKLAGPKEVQVAAPAAGVAIAHVYPTPFRTDVIDIPLTSGGDDNGADELEYKVRMRKGETLVYSWSVPVANPVEFYSDFHSQSEPTPEVKVISHKEGTGISANGSLVAPFDGIHGWYLQNQSAKPVVVRLKLAGFYQIMTPEEFAAEEAKAAAVAASQPVGPPR